MANETKTTGGSAADMAQNAAERFQAAGSAMADHGQQLGIKMLDQAEANTREAFAAMRAAAGAKDIGEVMRIQSDYLRDQGSRAVTQAREIGEMIASFGRATIGGLTGKE
ncbi:phasin family protein [Sphingomonas cannabina]|uniref:phasin family protein n=1 Tax=Sphingomonas cannabina TaxID=2899123 RepID=UPI001F26708F|nr:phasin family protein [Sphingomonas cannabina]UIJ44507.1 phasin family protein [Sphingomonas cannabina]